MTISIDGTGRLVIPKAIREAAGIRAGTPLEVRFRDGRIEIEPAAVEVSITEVGGVAIATAVEPMPPLTAEDVATVLANLRGERG